MASPLSREAATECSPRCNRLLKDSRMHTQPWKSGASAPRKRFRISVGFSPVVVFVARRVFQPPGKPGESGGTAKPQRGERLVLAHTLKPAAIPTAVPYARSRASTSAANRALGKSKYPLGRLETTVILRGTFSFSICRKTVSAADSPNSASCICMSSAIGSERRHVFKLHGSDRQRQFLRQDRVDCDHSFNAPLLKLDRNRVPLGSAIKRGENQQIAAPMQKGLHARHHPRHFGLRQYRM